MSNKVLNFAQIQPNLTVRSCDYSFGSFPICRLEKVLIGFLNIWIESRSWIEGKVFVHLVLLDLCKRGCECIAFDLIKHNVIVCLTCPPAECIAFENLCTIG